MRRAIGLSLWIFFLYTTAMAASNGELARQHMAAQPLPVPLPLSAPAANRAEADGEVARVKIVAGTATIVRNEKVITMNRDEKIYTGDTLKTGADGSMGITFRDNTILSLGPDSIVVIHEFLFAPAQGKLSIVTRLIKGTAAYLSGVIAKLSPQSVRFETPVGTVGFRGTKVLVRIDGRESN